MIERKVAAKARIGIFVVAHGVYWEQFEGLESNIMNFHNDLKKMVLKNDIEVIDFGMIDSSQKAYAAVSKILAADVDVLFCNMVTYATSSVFAPIIRDVDKPMVLVALQPRMAMDYTQANTFMQLENDNICSVPEFTGVAVRLGKKIEDVIIGCLYDDEEAEAEITEWCNIAKVLNSLKGARMGLMGHTMEAMYDMHADPTAISAAFGLHVPLLEIDDVVKVYNEVTEEEIKLKSEFILTEFDTPDPKSDPITMKLTDSDLYRAAKTAVALDKLVENIILQDLHITTKDNLVQFNRRLHLHLLLATQYLMLREYQCVVNLILRHVLLCLLWIDWVLAAVLRNFTHLISKRILFW